MIEETEMRSLIDQIMDLKLERTKVVKARQYEEAAALRDAEKKIIQRIKQDSSVKITDDLVCVQLEVEDSDYIRTFSIMSKTKSSDHDRTEIIMFHTLLKDMDDFYHGKFLREHDIV